MNTVKHVVTEVLGEPEYREWKDHSTGSQSSVVVSCWTLEVKGNCYGRTFEHTLTFDTKEEAEQVEPGYTFNA